MVIKYFYNKSVVDKYSALCKDFPQGPGKQRSASKKQVPGANSHDHSLLQIPLEDMGIDSYRSDTLYMK